MGRLILVEGMDLAGKSTGVTLLQRNLERAGWQVRRRRNSLCADNPLAQAAEHGCYEADRTPLEGACAFLAAHLWDARHFEAPGPGVLHLQDSCWLRTLAWEEAEGSRSLARKLRDASRTFPVFERAVFLTADLGTRLRRHARRAHNNAQDGLGFAQPARFLAVERRLRKVTMELVPTVEIDTSHLEPEEVLERCLQVFLAPHLRRPAENRAERPWPRALSREMKLPL